MNDNKHYILLTDGTYALERVEWDADSEKRAGNLIADGKYSFANGVTLKIFTKGDYEGGCSYAFACDGHWYLF